MLHGFKNPSNYARGVNKNSLNHAGNPSFSGDFLHAIALFTHPHHGELNLKTFATAVFLTMLTGCASYQPVPDGYTGPVATVADSGFAEDGSKAQLFVLSEIDGNTVPNSIGASAQASSGQGFRLNTRFMERKVPAKPMKVVLRASHTTGAPIQAIFSQVAGTFFSVEGVVDFNPRPDGKYIVKGELKKEGSRVWIEDVETNQPVTEKVTRK